MFKLDFTNCIANFRKYYICKECGNEYKFCNALNAKFCKCSKTSKGNTIVNAQKAITEIEKIFRDATTKEKCVVLNDFNLKVKLSGNRKINKRGESHLHEICRKKQIKDLIECIQSNFYNINERDNAGWTPLHEAIQSGFVTGVESLLNAGALPNVPGLEYATPLHKAAIRGDEVIIRILLKFGADLSVKDCWGNIPLAYIEDAQIRENVERLDIHGNCLPIKTVYVNRAFSVYGADEATVKELCATLKWRKALSVRSATHLIFDGELNVDTLVAVLKGLLIYKKKWIKRVISEKQEVPAVCIYGVPDLHACFVDSIINRLYCRPLLFDGMNFHVLQHKTPIMIHNIKLTTQNIRDLITFGGGKLLTREPTPSTVGKHKFRPYHISNNSILSECSHYIIYDERNTRDLLYNMNILCHKSSGWLVESILKFKIE